ncbi:MAG: hypothetical protein WCK06_04075 [Actinomycetota bacterium]
MSIDQQLQWEKRWRTPAVIAALLGGILPLVGVIVRLLLAPDQPLNKAGQLLYIDDHGLALMLSVVILGIGALAVGGTLYYLWVATKARKPEFPPAAKWGVVGGSVLVCLGQIILYALLIFKSSTYVSDGVFGYSAASQAQGDAPVVVASTAQLVGQLGMGFGVVMICLSAMRIGLLTRFMGVLGVISGVLLVIPLGGPLPIVQTFWLIALGFLLLGRWPTPVPAWESGLAQPWPGRQQQMEAQVAARGAGGSAPPAGGLLGGLFGARAKPALGSGDPPTGAPVALGDGEGGATGDISSPTSTNKRKRKKHR